MTNIASLRWDIVRTAVSRQRGSLDNVLRSGKVPVMAALGMDGTGEMKAERAEALTTKPDDGT